LPYKLESRGTMTVFSAATGNACPVPSPAATTTTATTPRQNVRDLFMIHPSLSEIPCTRSWAPRAALLCLTGRTRVGRCAAEDMGSARRHWGTTAFGRAPADSVGSSRRTVCWWPALSAEDDTSPKPSRTHWPGMYSGTRAPLGIRCSRPRGSRIVVPGSPERRRPLGPARRRRPRAHGMGGREH